MESLLNYLVEANAVLTVMIGVYYFFFYKEKFLHINRFILLGIFVVTFTLPLFPAFSYHQASSQQSNNISDQLSQLRENKSNNDKPNHLLQKTALTINARDLDLLIIIIYFLVVFILLGRLLFQLLQVFRITRRSTKQKVGGAVHCTPVEKVAPFSFFRFIVVRPDTFETEVYQQIMAHEQAHCRQLHSVDVLMSELICIVLWLNPIAFFYRRLVKLHLEFLADEQVLHSGTDRKNYQLNLLGTILNSQPNALVNSFNSSKIKQRVSMMNKERPPAKRKYKYALLIPLVLALYLVVNPPKAKSSSMKSSMLTNNPNESAHPIIITEAILAKEKHNKYTATINHSSSHRLTNRTSDIIIPTIFKVTKPATDKEAFFPIMIDARTDTVKVRLSSNKVMLSDGFMGIYIIENKVYTNKELRKALEATGKFDVVLPRRPMIGYYTPNDNDAIKKWGKQAIQGVVFVKVPIDTAIVKS